MKPSVISSAELPSLDFVDRLTDTLSDFGVSRQSVCGLHPGVLTLIQTLLRDSAELEADLIRLQRDCQRSARELEQSRVQHHSLLARLRQLPEGETRITERHAGRASHCPSSTRM